MLSFLLCTVFGATSGVPLVEDGVARAVVVLPAGAEPIAVYAAEELVYHVERASGVRLAVVHEPLSEKPASAVYVGATDAAREVGIDPDGLGSEIAVLRQVGDDFYIVGNDGPGDALSFGNVNSGTLWGVYEIVEMDLGARWLWPGELGEVIPHSDNIRIRKTDRYVSPMFVTRNQRPGLGRRGFAEGHERMSFSPEQAERYAHDQTVFLRRHRMGRSASSHRAQRSFGSGHSFQGWWEKYGEEHPEWFHLLPDGTRGPADLSRPDKVSMCVSNSELHKKIVELWQEELAKYPGERVNIDLSENDGSAYCVCEACRAWDGPAPDLESLPPGLERSFDPVQAGRRYARFAMEVHKLAAAIDPRVHVTYYAYLNYFWAPDPPLEMGPWIVIEFVPWFRWAGWFPRTDAEQQWVKHQWRKWRESGVNIHYRPNWFLDGYTMPLVYMHQFADAFQFYAEHGMIGTDFDSLQGQWAAQGPNLYLLSRLHVRPKEEVEVLLGEYYAAFGSAAEKVKAYFDYWEAYAVGNRDRAAEAIRSRSDGYFRRYAKYAQVADELYPVEVFGPAEALLDEAIEIARGDEDSVFAERVEFLLQGLVHARQCAIAAGVVNDPGTTLAEKKAAISELAELRRSLEHTNIANMDRAAIIEADSWSGIPELFEP